MASNVEVQRAAYEAFVASDESVTKAELALWLRRNLHGDYISLTMRAGWASWQASHITTIGRAVDICESLEQGGINGRLAARTIARKLKELLS